ARNAVIIGRIDQTDLSFSCNRHVNLGLNY
ncbi:MAG: hypothetical protein ACI9F1_002141, partial [Colwellia sp.]